ncbi:hypothetical protein OND84_004235 [Morganella morganii]|uniref:hypothetical protein n=1 Tax=Providencia TaxID=586 RepID=UPI00234916C6|nr:hypothetical protein [Providencia sp. PROV255]EMB6211518.1 hypothetical protein [Morganella morganii]EMB6212851.1 hypothetical protein [Morganella morganii]
MTQFVNLRGKRLAFSAKESSSIPPGASGLIYPKDAGFIITDEQSVERLFIEHDKATGISWFLKVGRRGLRRWFEPTNDETLKAFGLDILDYNASILLAGRIHQQCRKHLSTSSGH